MPGLIDDPDFRALSRPAQSDYLSQHDPDFGGLSPEAKSQWLDANVPQESTAQQLGSAAGAGVRGSVAGLDQLAANTLMLTRRALPYLGPYGGGKLNEDLLQRWENLYRERGQATAAEAEKGRRPGVANAAAEVAGGLPLNLLNAAAAVQLAGPVAGFAGLGALGAADQGPAQAAKEAAKGAVLGTVFGVTEGMNPLLRGAAVAAPTYLMSSDPDKVRAATEALAMGGLAALGAPARMKTVELEVEHAPVRSALDSLAEQGRALGDQGLQRDVQAPKTVESGAPEGGPALSELAREPGANTRPQLAEAQPEPTGGALGEPVGAAREGAAAEGVPAPEPMTAAPPMTPEQTREAFSKVVGPRPPEPQVSDLGRFAETTGGRVNADMIRQRQIDDTHGFLMAERYLHGDALPEGALNAVRRLRAVPEIARRIVDWGTPEFKEDGSIGFGGKPIGESFKELLAKVPEAQHGQEMTDTFNYAIARQAKELAGQGRERLVSPELIRAGMALETPERARWFEDMKAANERVADFMQKAGLFDAKQRADWNRNEFAFSFWRDFTGDLSRGGGGPGRPGQRGVYQLFGSERNLRNPEESLLGGMSRRIQLALENQARLKVADYASHPKGGALLEKIPASNEMARVRRDEATRQVLEPLAKADPTAAAAVRAAIEADSTLPEKLTMWAGQKPPPGNDVMTVYRNGKPEYYRIKDPVLLDAVQSIVRTPISREVVRWLGKTRRIFQKLTTATPDFIYRNFIRDPIAAWVFSRHGYTPFRGAMRDVIANYHEDAVFREMVANGGTGSTLRATPEEMRADVLRYAAKRKLDLRRIVVLPADALRLIDEIGQAIELAPRRAEYRLARASGKSAAEAAMAAREITTDFAQHGSGRTIQAMNAVLPFFSAMVASSDRFYRGWREPEQRASVAGKIGTIATLSVLLAAYNSLDPEYDKLEPWDKRGYWHIPTFGLLGDSADARWIRIPKAWEIGSVASAAEFLVEKYLLGTESTRDMNTVVELAKIFSQNFGISGGPIGTGLEEYMNRVVYTGSPVEPSGLRERQPWDRATAGTSPTLRKLGQLERNLPYQLSPARAQHILRGLFSYYASYTLWASDHLFFPGQTGLHWDDQPVLSSMIERAGRSNRFRDEFYDLLDTTNQAHASMMAAARSGNADIAQGLGAKPETNLSTAFTRAQRAISAMDKGIQQIDADPTLDAATKKKLHDDKTRERDLLMEQMVRLAKRAGVTP